MFTQITNLPDDVVAHIDGLGMPVRLLRGTGGVYTAPESWQGNTAGTGARNARCMREGVTLVSYGSPDVVADDPFVFRSAIPQPLTIHEMETVEAPREWINHRLPAGDYEALSADYDGTQAAYAIVGLGTVHYLMPIDGTLPWDEIDLEAFLSLPIRRAVQLRDDESERAAVRERERSEREAREEAEATERRQRAMRDGKAGYVRLRTAASRTELSDAENRLSRQQRYIRDYEESHRTAMVEAARLTERVGRLRALSEGEGDTSALEAQWDRFCEHPKVRDIRVDGDSLVIETTELTMSHPDDGRGEVPLGRMRLTFPSDGGTIRAVNLTRRMTDRVDHPHVDGGIPCFGGSYQIPSDLLASREYVGLFEFMLQYLETWNPDDGVHRRVSMWFDRDQRERARNQIADVEAVPAANAFAGNAQPRTPDGACDCADCRAAR